MKMGYYGETPSVEERLRAAQTAIAVISAALHMHSAWGNEIELNDPELRSGLIDLAAGASEELYFLRQLPAAVLNRPAPNGDQEEARQVKVTR